jgi:hypothetical protein
VSFGNTVEIAQRRNGTRRAAGRQAASSLQTQELSRDECDIIAHDAKELHDMTNPAIRRRHRPAFLFTLIRQ